jgi:hypothetical protein
MGYTPLDAERPHDAANDTVYPSAGWLSVSGMRQMAQTVPVE